MAALIDDLLQLSRFTRSDMHWEQVDLSSLAETVVRTFNSESRNAMWPW